MLDAEMRGRLEAAWRAHDLKGLVDELRHAGFSQVAIYDLFEAFYSELGHAGRVADEDELADTLDCIWGWCSPSARWFDDTLTDEVVRAYREASHGPTEPAGPGTGPHRGDTLDDAKRRFPVGTRVRGIVTQHCPFGVFVNLGDPVATGLIQVTEFLDEGRMTPDQYPAVGATIDAVVLGHTEDQRKQVWLSVRPSHLK